MARGSCTEGGGEAVGVGDAASGFVAGGDLGDLPHGRGRFLRIKWASPDISRPSVTRRGHFFLLLPVG